MEILNRRCQPLVYAMDALVATPPGDPLLRMCRYHLGLEEVDGTTCRAVRAGQSAPPCAWRCARPWAGS